MPIIPNEMSASQPEDFTIAENLPEILAARCLVIEPAPVELYWEEINRRHFEVIEKGGTHLLLSLRHYEKGEDPPISADIRRFASIAQGMNSELLGRFSLLLGDEIQSLNMQIDVDQFEMYTLEALFEEYLHEVSFSGFLEELDHLKVKGEGFSYEKERVKIWHELQVKLKYQKEILGKILEVVDPIAFSTSTPFLYDVLSSLYLLIDAELPDRVKTRAWRHLWIHFQDKPLLITKPGSQRELIFRSFMS